ncbi:hypothetical protein QQ045_022895 [Rhodiola kirilowii]
MSDARAKKINHHSGKVLFAQRAKRQLLKGHKAPHVTVYGEAYAGEPTTAKITEEMENKVLNMLDEGRRSLDEPLSEEIQLAIISEAVGEKKGIQISGVGKSISVEVDLILSCLEGKLRLKRKFGIVLV